MPNAAAIAKAHVRLAAAGAAIAGAAKRITELEAEAQKIANNLVALIIKTIKKDGPDADLDAAIAAANHYTKQIRKEIEKARRDLDKAVREYNKALIDLCKALR